MKKGIVSTQVALISIWRDEGLHYLPVIKATGQSRSIDCGIIIIIIILNKMLVLIVIPGNLS